MQGSPTGRLLCYDPADRSTRVVTEGLWFANGVALSADASWAAVVETVSLRVHRVWLSGPKVTPWLCAGCDLCQGNSIASSKSGTTL